MILCSKGFGCRDAESHTGSLDKAKDQKVQGVGGSYSSQGVGSQTAAYNNGICKAVELLKKCTQHQRKGKTKDLSQGASHGQIRCTGTVLFNCFHDKNSPCVFYGSILAWIPDEWGISLENISESVRFMLEFFKAFSRTQGGECARMIS